MEPLEPRSQIFHITDPRQRRIYEKLGILIQPGAAQFYFDACHVMSDWQRFSTATHIVAHLLREVESMMRYSLDPVLPSVRDTEEAEGKRVRQIASIVEEYRWDSRAPESEEWTEEWKKLCLHKWAHRSRLDSRPLDDSFLEFIKKAERIFDEILYNFEATYHAVVGPKIDRLLKVSDPCRGAKCLSQELPNSPAVLRHFFSRLNDPRWLKPLKIRGYFSSPPQPESTEDGLALIPPWPQGDYLKRVAAVQSTSVQAEVGEILAQVDVKDNFFVRIDLVDVAIALPANNTMAWAYQETRRVEAQEDLDSLLAHRLVAAVLHLARGGQQSEALRLASALLSVAPAMDERISALGSQPRIRIGETEYEELLTQVVGMASVPKAVPLAIETLCQLLDRTLVLCYGDMHNGSQCFIDRSGRFRTEIQDNPSHFEDVENWLVSAVRDAAKIAIESKTMSASEIVSQLDRYKWRVFRRLSLYILALFPNHDLIVDRLVDNKAFVSFDHEYKQLLQNHFGALPAAAQAKIFNWIDVGPDTNDYRSQMEQFYKRALYEEEVDRHVDYWRYTRLLPIRAWLPPIYRQQLNALEELREREQREEDGTLYEVEKQKSPPPDMRTAEINDIVAFLREDTDETITVINRLNDRLASKLADAVSADPERFAPKAVNFLDTGPNYLWHLLHGFHTAAQNGRRFIWGPVLELCDQILRISAGISGDNHPDTGQHLGWMDVRQRVASMLDNLMHEHDEKVPFRCRQSIWKLIEQLASDLPPEDQDTPYSSYADLAMAFLRNTCGQALHASVGYATWVQSNVEEHWQGFDDVPEVRELLDKHLAESSRAIRAIYGENYSVLAHLDLDWSRLNARRIFPIDDGYQYPMFQAAWLPYIACARPYSVLFDILKPQYELAIDGIPENDLERPGSTDPQAKLADHIMWLYLVGKIGLDNNDGVVGRFFGKASDGLRRSALNQVGRMLAKAENAVPTEVVRRAQDLWEWRLREARRVNRPAELAEFGYWFTSDKLPEEWALEQLREVVKHVRLVEQAHHITERLADVAPHFPLLAVQCLSGLLQDRMRTRGLAKMRYVRAILEAALTSDDASAQQLSKDEINRLDANNQADYTDLLKRNLE